MDDFFPKMSLRPNPHCDEYHCLKNQKVFAEKEAERLKNLPKEEEKPEEPEILHEENEWGISCVDSDEDDPDTGSTNTGIGEGVRLAYERRVTMEADAIKPTEESTNEQSLEDLMAQMKNM